MGPKNTILAILSLCALSFPASVLSPVSAQITPDLEISIGDVGPGQTFSVSVDGKVATGGKYGIGGAYDQLSASSLPSGWSSSPSKLYASPLQVEITVPKDAHDGEYGVGLTLWDEAGERGLGENITFKVKVIVKSEVVGLSVEPSRISTGAGQPARYTVTVVNKGIANDVFTIGSTGVRNWEFRRSIYIPSGTSKTLTYEVVGDEEADYSVRLFATSMSSERISQGHTVALTVNTDLFSDFRAVNKGVLLFPLTEAPVFFVFGLLSNLF